MSNNSQDKILTTFNELSNSFNRSDQYFDILYESNSSLSIVKTSTAEDISGLVHKAGFVARTFTNEWHEFASPVLADFNHIENRLPKVTQMGKNLREYEGWEIDAEIKPKINAEDIPLEDKINKMREIFKYVTDSDKRIITCRLTYTEQINTKIFLNNEGSQLKQIIPRTKIIVIPIAKKGKSIDFDYLSVGAEIGFEIFDNSYYENLDHAIESSIDLLSAENPPNGNYPIILDPDMAGLIAHESFGHGLEADQILRGRSYLTNKINSKVASEICNIYDTPNLKGAWGYYFFDDEGIKAGNNLLVENGILKSLIHDRKTASILKAEPQGNGRREDFAHVIHPRMTNTYFGHGDHNIEEMISEIKLGALLIHGYFGMEDPLGGNMVCTSKKGYLIKNGEKVKVLKMTALSGPVLDLLQNIDAVSKDKLELRPGTCGKGHADLVPVTSGGSYIKVEKALISPG